MIRACDAGYPALLSVPWVAGVAGYAARRFLSTVLVVEDRCRRVPGNGVRRLAYTGSYLRVPVSALRGVEALDDAHGWTGIGAGFVPGAFAA